MRQVFRPKFDQPNANVPEGAAFFASCGECITAIEASHLRPNNVTILRRGHQGSMVKPESRVVV